MNAADNILTKPRPHLKGPLISWKGIFGALLVFSAKSASASPFPNVSRHANQMFPIKNITGGPVGEIQCYALPYGAVGMISHLFTYWTIAWTGVGRTPAWPFHRTEHGKFTMALSIISLLICIPVATISIHRCRLTWHFVLIGFWKLTTSITQGCVAVHRAFIMHKFKHSASTSATSPMNNTANYQPINPANPQQQQGPDMFKHTSSSQTLQFIVQNYTPLWWLIVYLVGTTIGMVGLIGLIVSDFRHNSNVRSLTYGFVVAIAVLALTTVAYWYKLHLEQNNGELKGLIKAYLQTFGSFFIVLVAAFGFFSPLYSDMVLGAIAQNWSGFPSEENQVLYWTWFGAKRLPMFAH
ncbi:hypothetical protein AOQ84DRAFT_140832 [Glonium stellatum]|uniref:Uncharacterized protein n=1 Tax=Glonium stellatum TaxID=574774 RepID=A0A8E2ERV1_9PEZI|nr:hypothetical protein AOQ84DRAFT_140832 [Glonium stellatum]